MSQRDTIVPVCRLIGVGDGAFLGNIKLPYTGHWVESVTTSALSLSAVIGTQPSSIAGNGFSQGDYQNIDFLVSAATTTTQDARWATGHIRVEKSYPPFGPDEYITKETVLTTEGAYNENVLLGTTTGGTKVIMPDFSGMQITSMSLAGSAGNGVSWQTLITAASDIVALSSTYWEFSGPGQVDDGGGGTETGYLITPQDGLDGTEGFPSGTAPVDFSPGYNLSANTAAKTTFYANNAFGGVGDADTSLQIFASSTAAVGVMDPAADSPHGLSSTITIRDHGASRIVQFTPGNYNLDTSFSGDNLSLFTAGWTGTGISQNPAQVVLSSLVGDASAVYNITSGHTGAIFTTKISDSLAQPNYITVTDLSGTGGYFRVKPSSGSGYYVSGGGTESMNSINLNGSGVPGTIVGGGGTAVLSMMGGISEIDIENQVRQATVTAATVFAINYGVIKQSNVTGDGMKPDVK